jgi:hypothetical protein
MYSLVVMEINKLLEEVEPSRKFYGFFDPTNQTSTAGIVRNRIF